MIKIIELDECGSTNDEAWKNAPGPALVTARRQTRGRGRQGRAWESGSKHGDDDAITISLVTPPPAGNVEWIPLAAGVAAAEAITEACGLLPTPPDLSTFRLKWPNDLMLADAKLGGILCESRVVGEKVSGIVVGFGMNYRHAPMITGMKTASLADAVSNLSGATRHFIIRHWADRLVHWCEELSKGNTAALRQAWLSFAKLDRYPTFSVHSRDGSGRIQLVARDIDERGRLKASMNGETVYLDQADTI